ncbi:hypothetical protein D9757_001572 [Collybiopsis confluens]|uniref:DUF6535 domain-containing protein n=1 Tax=Collybiopsis confluens TaxID=2823264 RepID=A0A8H5HZ98_9AGAR|nr:hypothetical protein D9757_001572 [Collybiopsis confluens]
MSIHSAESNASNASGVYSVVVESSPSNEKPGVMPPSDSTKLWKEGDKYRYLPPSQSDPWEICTSAVHKQNLAKFGGWKEEVDTLLVFAGLFSAVVTAFTVQSYQLLGPGNDSIGTTTLLLLRISQQLNSSNVPPADMSDVLPAGGSWGPIRVNVLWFLSLSLSLSSALIGILCKQWIREAQRDISSHIDAFRLGQLRDESLEKWGVSDILFSIPILLEIGLILFFAGLLDFLWSLNSVVAGIISGYIGLVILFIFCVTFAPALYTLNYLQRLSSGMTTRVPLFPCSWKSPQSWLLVRLAMYLYLSFRAAKKSWDDRFSLDSSSMSSAWPLEEVIDACSDWESLDIEILHSVPKQKGSKDHYREQGMKRMIKSFGFDTNMMLPIFQCLQECELDEAAGAVGLDTGQNLSSFLSWDSLNEELLHTYCLRLRELAPFRVEIFVRRINGSATGPVLTSILGIWFELKQSCAVLEPELCQQVVDSISSYLHRGGRLWEQDFNHLLHIAQMLSTHPTYPISIDFESNSESPKSQNPIIDALCTWVSGHSDENPHKKRVLHSTWGVGSVLSTPYIPTPLGCSSEFARLVAAVDVTVTTTLDEPRVRKWKDDVLSRIIGLSGFQMDAFADFVGRLERQEG